MAKLGARMLALLVLLVHVPLELRVYNVVLLHAVQKLELVQVPQFVPQAPQVRFVVKLYPAWQPTQTLVLFAIAQWVSVKVPLTHSPVWVR
jgi:hypothetical protein